MCAPGRTGRERHPCAAIDGARAMGAETRSRAGACGHRTECTSCAILFRIALTQAPGIGSAVIASPHPTLKRVALKRQMNGEVHQEQSKAIQCLHRDSGCSRLHEVRRLQNLREPLLVRGMPINRWIAALPSVARDDGFEQMQRFHGPKYVPFDTIPVSGPAAGRDCSPSAPAGNRRLPAARHRSRRDT